MDGKERLKRLEARTGKPVPDVRFAVECAMGKHSMRRGSMSAASAVADRMTPRLAGCSPLMTQPDYGTGGIEQRLEDMQHKEADAALVERRIDRTIRDPKLREDLKHKVEQYDKTHNQQVDLTNQESGMIYRDVNFDEKEQLSKKTDLDVKWSNHAKYRSELRDIPHQEVNDALAGKLKDKLNKPDSKKVIFKENGANIVTDYDMRRKPAEADVITVY